MKNVIFQYPLTRTVNCSCICFYMNKTNLKLINFSPNRNFGLDKTIIDFGRFYVLTEEDCRGKVLKTSLDWNRRQKIVQLPFVVNDNDITRNINDDISNHELYTGISNFCHFKVSRNTHDVINVTKVEFYLAILKEVCVLP